MKKLQELQDRAKAIESRLNEMYKSGDTDTAEVKELRSKYSLVYGTFRLYSALYKGRLLLVVEKGFPKSLHEVIKDGKELKTFDFLVFADVLPFKLRNLASEKYLFIEEMGQRLHGLGLIDNKDLFESLYNRLGVINV